MINSTIITINIEQTPINNSNKKYSIMKFNILKITSIFALLLLFTACNREDDPIDDLPQEEISNALLLITDNADNITKVYNYQVNGSNIPNIKLENGHEYTVEIALKNGAEDVTQEVKDAKDEHFFTFDFPNSDIVLTRLDDATSTRSDGSKVGLTTKWKVNTAVKSGTAQVILTLYHESISVSENSQASGNGTVYGTQNGGETDLNVNYQISNL